MMQKPIENRQTDCKGLYAFVRVVWAVARARVADIRRDFDPAICEVGAIAAQFWCAYVLLTNPGYLFTSPRLAVLAQYADAWVWGALFAAFGVYELVCLLLGGAVWVGDKGDKFNPFMNTPGRVRGWMVARMIGLLLCMGLNSAVGRLLSVNGPSIGAGFFVIVVVCCLSAACRVSPLYFVEWIVEADRRRATGRRLPRVLKLALRAGRVPAS